MSDDSLIREVDEAVRQEQLKKLWDKYGIFALAGAVAIVAAVAGYKGWGYWKEKRAADAGARFIGALTLRDDGKNADAERALQELSENGPAGYRLLARFQLAAATARNGKTDEAVKAYDALAGASGASAALRNLARIKAAVLRADTADLAEMKRRVGDLADGSSAWRHSARELVGLVAYRTGNNAEAEKYLTAVLSDPATPQSMRQRAEMLLSLVVKADPTAAKSN